MRLVDLSLPIINSEDSAPVLLPMDHVVSALRRGESLGFDPALLPEPGIHMASERFDLATHQGGTHVDAPWHYGPQSEGRPARTIDQLPLEWFFSDGVKLDCTSLPAEGTIDLEMVQSELRRIGYALKALDIVLLQTGADRFWGLKRYETSSPDVNREAVEWLLDQGVKVIGIDAFSPDRAVRASVGELIDGHPERFLPVHMLGREREFCIVEKLANLSAIPAAGFRVCMFPVKVQRGSGGWCRAVALLSD
jgi:kynurenine formamidase